MLHKYRSTCYLSTCYLSTCHLPPLSTLTVQHRGFICGLSRVMPGPALPDSVDPVLKQRAPTLHHSARILVQFHHSQGDLRPSVKHPN